MKTSSVSLTRALAVPTRTILGYAIVFLAVVTVLPLLSAQEPIITTSVATESIESPVTEADPPPVMVHPVWEVAFSNVPELLRLHCPELGTAGSLVVNRVEPSGRADRVYDLRSGDVPVRVGHLNVDDLDSLPPVTGVPLTVMRQGEMVLLPMRADNHTDHAVSAVIASAVATGNESVAVARSGNRIVLEYSSDVTKGPIRLQGTPAEITQAVNNSDLSPKLRRRLLEAIR